MPPHHIPAEANSWSVSVVLPELVSEILGEFSRVILPPSAKAWAQHRMGRRRHFTTRPIATDRKQAMPEAVKVVPSIPIGRSDAITSAWSSARSSLEVKRLSSASEARRFLGSGQSP